MAILGKNFVGKVFQHSLFGQIAYIIIVGEPVNDTDMGSLFAKFLGNGFPDALGTAGYHDHLICKHKNSSLR